MSTVEKGPSAPGFVERVRNLLLRPGATWEVIDGEAATVGGLYRGWVIPLVALSVLCYAIGALAFGYGMGGFGYRPGVVPVAVTAILTFALQMVLVYVMALVIDALAPNFGGQKSRIQALKVSAYGATAAWLAGVFQIYPPLGVLGLLGLYSVWLFYKGLPTLMKVPREKALGYTAAVVAIAVVFSIVGGMIVGAVSAASHMGGMMGGMDRGEITTPGGKIDMAGLEQSARALEEAARKAEAGEGPVAVEPDLLKGYLPAQIGGFTRTDVSAGSAGAAGLSGSGVEGSYARGEAVMRLSVTDVGSAAPLAAMARAFDVSSSTESNGRYEKVGKVDGRMTFERFNRDAGRGQYSVLIGDRFMVEATGEGVTMQELKAAVAAVDPAGLEALAES